MSHASGATTATLDTSTGEFITLTTGGILLAADMDNSEFKQFEEQNGSF